MLGSSRESMRAASEELRARSGDSALGDVGRELLEVAALLGRETSLRATLSDSGTPVQIRSGVVASLLGERVSATTADIVSGVVSQRWSSGRDLVDALDRLAAEALFTAAERDGRIDTVEDELFRFGRAVQANGELAFALTDAALPADRKVGIVTSLLEGRSEPETLALLTHVVTNPRGRTVSGSVDELVELAAVRRERVSAEVTSAVPLDAAQHTRLAAALGRIYGRDVDLRTVVDPDVIGGITVRVGDEVIDGTTAHRLEQARRRLVG